MLSNSNICLSWLLISSFIESLAAWNASFFVCVSVSAKDTSKWIYALFYHERVLVKRSLAQNANCSFFPPFVGFLVLFGLLFSLLYIYCLFAFFGRLQTLLFPVLLLLLLLFFYLPLHRLNLNKFICRSCKKGPLKNKSNKYLWKCWNRAKSHTTSSIRAAHWSSEPSQQQKWHTKYCVPLYHLLKL